jgi:hypothetical protein
LNLSWLPSQFSSSDNSQVQVPLKSAIIDSFSEQSISSGKHYLEIKIPSADDGVLENMVVGLAYLNKKDQKIAI